MNMGDDLGILPLHNEFLQLYIDHYHLRSFIIIYMSTEHISMKIHTAGVTIIVDR